MGATFNSEKKETYYGCIEEIRELDYGLNFKVPLFQCQWVKMTGGRVRKGSVRNDNSGPQQSWV